MFNCEDANSLKLQRLAECEMAAFLKAVVQSLGADNSSLAENAWLNVLESLNWPEENPQKFFRSVSIQATSQIVADFTVVAKRGRSEGQHLQPVLQ